MFAKSKSSCTVPRPTRPRGPPVVELDRAGLPRHVWRARGSALIIRVTARQMLAGGSTPAAILRAIEWCVLNHPSFSPTIGGTS